MKKSDWVVALALAACATTLAACGGSANGSGNEQAKAEEAQLEFAECMREHGVNVPDPKPGDRGVVIAGTATGGPGGKKTMGVNLAAPATDAALKACKGKLGSLGQEPSPKQQEEFKEEALEFAECIREHGVNMPDPQFSGGGVKQRIGGPGVKNSPTFRAAQEACQSKAPGGGKGGVGVMLGVPPK